MHGNQSLTPQQLYHQAWHRRRKAEQARHRPPDPIELLSAEDRAYLAGLVDGKGGSIYVGAVGPHRERTVYPIVALAMTHRPVIEWVVARLASGGPHLHGRKDPRRPDVKPIYRTQLYGQRARLLCATLLPFLRVKAEQARLVTEFPVEARIGPGRRIEESGINEVRFRLRDEINALNHAATRRPGVYRDLEPPGLPR